MDTTTTTLLYLTTLVLGGMLIINLGTLVLKTLWGIAKSMARVIAIGLIVSAPFVAYNSLSLDAKSHIKSFIEEHKESIKAIELEESIKDAPRAIIIEE